MLAARDGILGALREDLLDASKESAATVRAGAHAGRRVRLMPGQAFGSCRVKLKSVEADRVRYERLLDVLAAHDVHWSLYCNGGNDSAGTALKVSGLAAESATR